MSRSYRRPYTTACKKSASDKRLLSKRRRAMEKDALAKGRELPIKNQEVLDLWDFRQDGTTVYCPGDESLARK